MKKLKVTLTTMTGLHIGGGQGGVAIGGLDDAFIRDPSTKLPYIPGSSIKGKIRCLLELNEGKYGDKGGPCDCGNCEICRVFGHTHQKEEKGKDEKKNGTGPTRILVRDAKLREDSEKKFIDSDSSPMEVKTEIQIDRQTGTSKSGLRTQERVPPGYFFEFDIIYRDFLAKDDDERKEDVALIIKGLGFLKDDALGKSGSRGYGQIDYPEETIEAMNKFKNSYS